MIPRQLLLVLGLASAGSAFVVPHNNHVHARTSSSQSTAIPLLARKSDDDEDTAMQPLKIAENALKSTFLAAALSVGTWTAPAVVPPAVAATDPGAIVGCLLSKCQVQFAKCITNPGCLANVICINSCNNKEDETGCQIQCGDIFDNAVIGEFNKCAVSDMSCVPQKPDEGKYPVPTHEQMVPKFDTKFFDGRLFITAGLNPLFDIFPCQVHFFTETSPGNFFGKLNWDIVEPDGELFTRDAVQQFVADPKEPAHLINHDNEYLHYKDDWYIIDAEYDDNKDGIPPFAFVFYRGSNDAWDGYGTLRFVDRRYSMHDSVQARMISPFFLTLGGAVIYTRASQLPTSLIPRLEAAAKKIGLSWDDFTVTDNSCKKPDEGEKIELRKKFLGNVVLQTEEQVQAQATRFRGNAVNSIKAQKIFFNNQGGEAEKAFNSLRDQTLEFEKRK